MPNLYVTKNYQEAGGDRWIIGDGGNLLHAAPDVAGALIGALPHHYQIAPAAISATAVHAAILLAAAAKDVTTSITNPDFPRNVTVKGNAAGITGDVVITGTNIAGDEIEETIALNGATEALGALAFASVTNIHLPAETHEGTDTVSIGRGKVFGLPHIVYNAAFLIVKLFDGSSDSGSLSADADELEKNTFSLNGAPNGSKLVDLVYLR